MPDEIPSDSKVWEIGRDLAAQLAGSAITLRYPELAVAGALAPIFVKNALDHARNTCFGGLLAKREQIRLSALEILVSREIQRRLNQGDQPREDALSEDYIPERSDADEITEAIFRIAQRDPEERKLPYIAKLLSSIVFNPQIDAKLAHHLTSVANSLSFRKLCLLELARDATRFDLFNDHLDKIGRQNISEELLSILSDLFDLKQRTLLFTGSDLDLNAFEIRPAFLRLERLGALLHETMGLEVIPPWEVKSLANRLSFGHGPFPPRAHS